MADMVSKTEASEPPDAGFSVLNPKSSNFYFFPNESSMDDSRFLSTMFSSDFAENSSHVGNFDSLWAASGFDEWQIRDILQSFSTDSQWCNMGISDDIPDATQTFLTNETSQYQSTNENPKDESTEETVDLSYVCSFCNSKCSNFVEYFKHRKKHLKEKPFKCNLSGGTCSASFNCEENLELHQIAYHSSPDREKKRSVQSEHEFVKLTCSRCEMSFTRISKWKAHLMTHVKDEFFTCELCDVSFEFLAEYESHEMEHINGKKTPKLTLDTSLQCKLCGKYFLSKNTLTYHVQLKCKHPAVRNFAKKFSRRTRDPDSAELPPADRRKQSKIASDVKNQCSFCGKRFLKPCQVKRHEVVHTKEKKYQCPLCLKKFSQKSSLKTHEKIHESNADSNTDKSITCELCDRKFIQKANYIQHLRTCHRELFGENADHCHLCPHCSCTFDTAQGLSAHVSRHHPEKPSMKTRVALVSENNRRKADEAKNTNYVPSDCSVLIKNKVFQQVVLDKNSFTVPETTKAFARHAFGPTAFNSGHLSVTPELAQMGEDNLYVIDSYASAAGASDEPAPATRNDPYFTTSTGCPETSSSLSPAPASSKLKMVRKHEPNDKLSNLDLHLRKVGKDGKFEASICQFCGKEFKKSCDLVRHIRKHTNEKPYPCEKCGKRFSTKFGLSQHLKFQHAETEKNIENKHSCEICHKSLATSQSLSVHMRIHLKVKAFSCSLCSKTFTTKSQLKAHAKTHDKKVFTTLYRKGSASNVAEVDTEEQEDSRQMKETLLKDPLLVTSAGVFRSVSSKSDHGFKCWDVGQDRAKYSCSKCNKKFKNAGYCRRHMSAHSASTAYQFNCSLCQKKFKTNVTLKCHILKHFRTERKFKCDDCPKTFTMKWHLKWHKSSLHTSTRPFMCPYCGKSFKMMHMCKKHIRTHLKELKEGKSTNPDFETLQTLIPEPENDAIAVGDAFSSLRIIPRPGGKSYGKEVTLIDADEMLKKKLSDTNFKESSHVPQSENTQTFENVLKETTEFNVPPSLTLSRGHISDISLQEHDYITWAGPTVGTLFISDTPSFIEQENNAIHTNFLQTENIPSMEIPSSASVFLPVNLDPNNQSNISSHTWNQTSDGNAISNPIVVSEQNFTGPQFAFPLEVIPRTMEMDGQPVPHQVVESVSASISSNFQMQQSHQFNQTLQTSGIVFNTVSGPDVASFPRPVDCETSYTTIINSTESQMNQSIENSHDIATELNSSFSLDFPNRTGTADIIILPNISQLSQKQPPLLTESVADIEPISLLESSESARSNVCESPSKFKYSCPDCPKSYSTTFKLKAHRVYTHNSSDIVDLSAKRFSPAGYDHQKSRGKSLDNYRNEQFKANGAKSQNDGAWTLAEIYPRQHRNRVGFRKLAVPRPRARNDRWQCELCGLVFTSQSKFRTHFNSYHIMKPQCLSGSLSSTGPPPKYKSVDFIRISQQDANDIKCKMAETKKEDQKNVTISEKILLKSIDEITKEVQLDTHGSAHLYHKQLRLTQNKMFQCRDCPKAFSSNSALKLHVRSHTNERPFNCSFCRRSYKTQSSFNYHIASHWRTSKLFTCHLCKRQFVSASSLSLHMRLHSGAAPLRCRFCPRKFNSSYQRQYHMDQFHFTSKMQTRRAKEAQYRESRKLTQRHKLLNYPAPASNFGHNATHVHLPALDENFLSKAPPQAVPDMQMVSAMQMPQGVNSAQGHITQMTSSEYGAYTCYAPAEVPYYANDRIIFSYDTPTLPPPTSGPPGNNQNMYMEPHLNDNTLPLSQHVYDSNMAPDHFNMQHNVVPPVVQNQLHPMVLPNSGFPTLDGTVQQ